MPIILYRVDERLIHGQVVVGWGNELHPTRIVVIDDDLADSEWEQELYGLGLPPGIEATFSDVAGGRECIGQWRDGAERIILLTRDIGTMRRLADGGGMRGEEVNLGGIHYAPGRHAVLPYLYLSADERDEVENLGTAGAKVSARDLPGSKRIAAEQLLSHHEQP